MGEFRETFLLALVFWVIYRLEKDESLKSMALLMAVLWGVAAFVELARYIIKGG